MAYQGYWMGGLFIGYPRLGRYGGHGIQMILSKLIDIGFCGGFHRILKLILDGFKDIGRSEVANPRQSTHETKIYVNNYVDKSTIALFYLYGFYLTNS
jgi:hypothetical protein